MMKNFTLILAIGLILAINGSAAEAEDYGIRGRIRAAVQRVACLKQTRARCRQQCAPAPTCADPLSVELIIEVTNSSAPDAGTVHPIYVSGQGSSLNYGFNMVPSTQPNETSTHVQQLGGSYIETMYFTLKGLSPDPPTDNWKPAHIRILQNGSPIFDEMWTKEFNATNRTYRIYP
jgi:hypothetical protein